MANYLQTINDDQAIVQKHLGHTPSKEEGREIKSNVLRLYSFFLKTGKKPSKKPNSESVKCFSK